MGFKDYCENKTSRQDSAKNETFGHESANDETKKVEDLYNTYKGKSESELMEMLINNVATQKANGTFDSEKVMSSINKMKPFLTEEQFNKILTILQKIN